MSPRRVLPRGAVALAGLSAVAVCAVPATSLPAVAAPAAPARPSLVSVTVAVPSALRSSPLNKKRTLKVPRGWTVSVWARPKKARLLAFTPDDRLLVSRPAYGVVTRLTPNKRGRPTSSTLLKGLRQPHGMAFDGSTLYIAESNRIDAYTYAHGKATGRRTVLSGLPDSKSKDLGGAYAHALKSVVVGDDHALYVSIGSRANVSAGRPFGHPAAREHPAGRPADRHVHGLRPRGAQRHRARGRSRRCGLDRGEQPRQRRLPVPPRLRQRRERRLQEGHDVLRQRPPDGAAGQADAGRDLGWPYCNPDPDVQPGVRGTSLDYSDRGFVRDVQTNADGSQLNCSSLPAVEQGLPAHSAPLGLSFASDVHGLGAGALVGVHGSWDRTPPRAPEVSFFPYSGGDLGNRETLVSGWQSTSGKRWGRAVAAVQGPDGAIYVSDDVANAVYRVAPPK